MLEKEIISLFKDAKLISLEIPINSIESHKYSLIALGEQFRNLEHFAELSTSWRNKNKDAFFSVFNADTKRTLNWLIEKIIDNPFRIMFAVKSISKGFIGQFGLEYHPSRGVLEIGNILKSNIPVKGVMTEAMNSLCGWIYHNTTAESIFLQVFSDNIKAKKMYEKNGFKVMSILNYSLKEYSNNEKIWVQATPSSHELCRNVYFMKQNKLSYRK